MPRAGLISLVIFCLSIGLAASAPLPERVSNLAQRSDDYDNDFIAPSLTTLVDRNSDAADAEYTAREYLAFFDDRELDNADVEDILNRDYDLSILDGREFDEVEQEYTKRDDSEVSMLYGRSIFSKIKKAFKKLGHKLKAGFKKIGKGIKKGFQKVGKGLKKAGQAIKKGMKKVGKFIKKTAAKVAKVALKLGAAVASVASKVVKFIPGIGTGISMALKGAAYGANVASDKIHANLGKFGKFTKGLDYVINPLGSAGKAIAKKGGKAGSIASSLLF